MKKLLFVMAVLAMVAPATFARDYMHMVLDPVTGQRTGATSWDTTATTVGLEQPDVNWEYDGDNSERKGESWNWPATYDWQDICVIPVRMDIGIWVKVADCKTRKLDLKQVEIHKYRGSVDIYVSTNANIEVGAYWTKGKDSAGNDFNFGSYSSSVGVSPQYLTPGSGQKVTITLTLSSVDISNISPVNPGGTNCVVVGTVTVRVRPNWKPSLAGGCGG